MRVSDVAGPRRIDLNVDIGEGFPFDEELLRFATSANICCGSHAGSIELTRHTVNLCRKHKVRFGAHPGYPDRDTMGRAPMREGQERQYLRSVFDQLTDFESFARPEYIKPHGALYNDTAIILPEEWNKPDRDHSAYEAGGIFLSHFPGVHSLAMLLRVHKLPLMGLPGTAHEEAARRAGQTFIREGFADRAYAGDGSLTPRSSPGAVLSDPAQIRRQVLELVGKVDTICLHGDTPGCVEIAGMVREALETEGVEVGP